MEPIILRDQDLAKEYLLQGLWFQRAIHPTSSTVKQALEWALIIADAGHLLPPTGFVADVGHASLGLDRDTKVHKDQVVIPGLAPGLARTYEDHVLGKLYADWSFERASDALKRIEPDKRGLGLAYMVKQLRERAGFGGVELSPGIIRGLLEPGNKPDDLLSRGWESLHQRGPLPILLELYEQIIGAARRMAEVLGDEDVKALEQKTALLSMGEYVAHRQVWQMAMRLEEGLPKHKVKPLHGRQEVPTRVLDEDSYPVGGFTSISTRGSIESLLHSQLAYMERDKALQPDLFDIKFLRDELYYYSRDENQFLRRRRCFLFVLMPDLTRARYKDVELPCQRLVLLLSFLLTSVRKLSEWLSTDALRFELLFVLEGDKKPLDEESKLMALSLREFIENQTVAIEHLPASELTIRLKERASRSLCHCLLMSAQEMTIRSQEAVVTSLLVDGPRPIVTIREVPIPVVDGEEPMDAWIKVLTTCLQLWI